MNNNIHTHVNSFHSNHSLLIMITLPTQLTPLSFGSLLRSHVKPFGCWSAERHSNSFRIRAPFSNKSIPSLYLFSEKTCSLNALELLGMFDFLEASHYHLSLVGFGRERPTITFFFSVFYFEHRFNLFSRWTDLFF